MAVQEDAVAHATDDDVLGAVAEPGLAQELADQATRIQAETGQRLGMQRAEAVAGKSRQATLPGRDSPDKRPTSTARS